MRRYDLGDPPGQEVPDDDTAIVAADGEKGALAVEHARDGARNAVEGAVEFFWVVLTE